jgi:protein-S-isoprenylcysteine O-methyltransferase Ste14
MATSQGVAPAGPNISFNLMRVLGLPWLDRTIAAVACVPLVYLTYSRYVHGQHGLPLIASAVGILIVVITMVVRRPPKRVTPNPWYWLLAFVATYWQVLVLGLMQPGRPLTPNSVTDSIALAGLLIVIWARLSLGRNIGFVPAQRELVHAGAYAYMRHPIYTGLALSWLGFALRAYSPRNALLLGLGVFWFIPVKSLVEEDFLRADPQYAAYMRKVRARWVPHLL